MPNLTFFVLAVIAGCSCLAACLVRIKKDASETDELLHESALYRSMSNSSLVVDNYESVIDTQPRNRHQS